ncbi:methionine adenosyltransferase [Patescibacteria group bacterium]|nr:methionine adenosyltransferase [Patescibacteria group bacterium]
MRTAECVMPGHPDKICDQIADAILDEFLKQDPNSRVAIEVLGGHGQIFIIGEVTSAGTVNYEVIARQVLSELGVRGDYQFAINVVKQSPDIAQGVDSGGAGDQGVMVGYATSETPEMLPLPFALARRITHKLFELGPELHLGPDGKAQVTVDDSGRPTKIVVSVQHPETMTIETARALIKNKILEPLFGNLANIELFINATGRFVVGGFDGDAGVTGRKLVVDAYGPEINVGGGAFSGKDATKVDRSAAYMARYLAKKLIKEKQVSWAKVTLAYSIGVAEPLMVKTEPEATWADELKNQFNLTPKGMIDFLDLRQPIYLATARLGHFGRVGPPWEKTA